MTCNNLGVGWREAMNDVNFVQWVRRNNMSNLLDEAYSEFNEIQALTVDQFECNLF